MVGEGSSGAQDATSVGLVQMRGIKVSPLRLRSHRRGVKAEVWTVLNDRAPRTDEHRRMLARAYSTYASGGVKPAPKLDHLGNDGRPIEVFLVSRPNGGDPLKVELGTTSKKARCTCWFNRGFQVACEDIEAARMFRDARGGFPVEAVTAAPPVRRHRDSHLYKLSRRVEAPLVHYLTRELADAVVDPRPQSSVGRPLTPLGDLIYASAIKAEEIAYGGELEFGRRLGFFPDRPNGRRAVGITAVSSFLNQGWVTELLTGLISFSALPLRRQMRSIAVDSSGFKLDQYGQWQVERLKADPDKLEVGKEVKPKEPNSTVVWVHEYLKLHFCVDTETGIATTARVSRCKYLRDAKGEKLPGQGPIADSPNFQLMLEESVRRGIDGLDYVADKAYVKILSHTGVWNQGGRCFVPPRVGEGHNKKGSVAWKALMDWFYDDFWTWKAHYNDRTAVERAFAALKKTLSDDVLSKTFTAQTNEALLMVLVYNLRILVRYSVMRPDILRGLGRLFAEDYPFDDADGQPPAPIPAPPPGPGDTPADMIARPPPPKLHGERLVEVLFENRAPDMETPPEE